jgi:hypothetical protein
MGFFLLLIVFGVFIAIIALWAVGAVLLGAVTVAELREYMAGRFAKASRPAHTAAK